MSLFLFCFYFGGNMVRSRVLSSLRDLLFIFAAYAQNSKGGALLFFKVLSQLTEEMSCLENEKQELQSEPEARLVTLKAVVSAHDIDDPSPAIFIMLPGED
ncbi:hypothetical protein [Mangrovibacterium marinum]|uniref:hypothetical protein n=1 Tax=Mangrovibacterium marinum TaxID=1639118 RepID=UPI002A18D11C|nr:hypothetical protein [Mangrovibacterium marinum]